MHHLNENSAYDHVSDIRTKVTILILTGVEVNTEQVAQLSQRDRAAGWVSNGQKWKTGTERQYLRTV